MSVRRRLHEVLEIGASEDKLSLAFDKFIISLILLNTFAVVLESVKQIDVRFGLYFDAFEIFSVAVFTIEYFLRLWICTLNEKFDSPIVGRLKYMLSPMAIIDLLAIIPFYLPFFFAIDLRFVRILRMLRLIRVLKLARYSKTLQKFGRVLADKKEELTVTVGIVFLLLVLASSLMYYVEHPAQPEVFSSIPAAMWWGVATLTTVGYGDVYPITPLGKLLGALIALLGVGMVALPTGIIGSGFMEEIQKDVTEESNVCPHCGKGLEREK